MADTSNSNPNNGQNPNGDIEIYYLTSAEALHSHVLEIATGTNILESITDYVQRRDLGVTVLSGSGFVTNVTLHHPEYLPDGVLTLDGRFPIMHLSGTFLPSPPGFSRLTIYLGRGEGQIVACSVADTLVASGPVTVNAVTFTRVVYDRLSLEEDGANGAGEMQSQPASSASVDPPASSVRGSGFCFLRILQ